MANEIMSQRWIQWSQIKYTSSDIIRNAISTWSIIPHPSPGTAQIMIIILTGSTQQTTTPLVPATNTIFFSALALWLRFAARLQHTAMISQGDAWDSHRQRNIRLLSPAIASEHAPSILLHPVLCGRWSISHARSFQIRTASLYELVDLSVHFIFFLFVFSGPKTVAGVVLAIG